MADIIYVNEWRDGRKMGQINETDESGGFTIEEKGKVDEIETNKLKYATEFAITYSPTISI